MNPLYKKDGITYSTYLEENIDNKLDKELKKHRTYSNYHVKPRGKYGGSSKS